MFQDMATKSTERARVIGQLVSQARDEAGLKNSSLALKAGVPRRTVVRIVNGHNEPNLATLERLANATDKPVDFFRPETVAPASERVRIAAEDLVEALVEALRERIESDARQEVAS